DRHAEREIVARLLEIAPALVAAPVEQHLVHLHAAPEHRAVFAVARREHVFFPHRGAHADVRRLVAEAGSVGAELARALQVHRLRVEHARFGHHAVHLHELVDVAREIGHVGAGVALGIQELTVLDREIRNRFHVYSNGRSRGARGRYRCWAAADGAALYIRVPGLAGARATTIVVARARIRAHPGGKSAYNACTSLQKNASHETARTRAHDPQAPGSGQRLLGLPEARPAAPGAGAAQRSP